MGSPLREMLGKAVSSPKRVQNYLVGGQLLRRARDVEKWHSRRPLSEGRRPHEGAYTEKRGQKRNQQHFSNVTSWAGVIRKVRALFTQFTSVVAEVCVGPCWLIHWGVRALRRDWERAMLRCWGEYRDVQRYRMLETAWTISIVGVWGRWWWVVSNFRGAGTYYL